VVVLARTSKAAQRLTKQFRERETSKFYWALVSGSPPAQGELRDWLIKDERQQKVIVVAAQTPGAKEAVLRFRVREAMRGGAWLEVELITGRKHQIRVQLAARGWPVLGDAKYGSRESFASGIALHARTLELEHPVQKQPLSITAPVPKAWEKWGVS
jgi:23S rRNA pseudouridine1911/1915/1917 synthase